MVGEVMPLQCAPNQEERKASFYHSLLTCYGLSFEYHIGAVSLGMTAPVIAHKYSKRGKAKRDCKTLGREATMK